MRRFSFIIVVLAAMSGSAWAQSATGSTPLGTSGSQPASVVSPGVGTNLQLPATTSSSAYDSSLPRSVVSPGVGTNLQLPATTSSSAYDSSLPPTAEPTTIGGITTQGNPNPTVGGLPTTTPP